MVSLLCLFHKCASRSFRKKGREGKAEEPYWHRHLKGHLNLHSYQSPQIPHTNTQRKLFVLAALYHRVFRVMYFVSALNASLNFCLFFFCICKFVLLDFYLYVLDFNCACIPLSSCPALVFQNGDFVCVFKCVFKRMFFI